VADRPDGGVKKNKISEKLRKIIFPHPPVGHLPPEWEGVLSNA